MYFLYSLLLYLLLPFLFIRLWYKQFKSKGYLKYSQRGRWKERLAIVPKHIRNSRPIWIHTVSVGEFIAARPFIQLIKEQHPDIPLLITSTTMTGSEQIINTFADSVYHMYIPWDIPAVMRRFYRLINPKAALILETEIWPGLIIEAKKLHIPVFLLNARMSEKSERSYLKIKHFTRSIIKGFEHICVQNDADKSRFINLGCSQQQLSVTGNIKFDLTINTKQIKQANELKKHLLWDKNQILLFSSTHIGEDDLAIKLFWQLRKINPTLKLILVPRHPERFKQVEYLANNSLPDDHKNCIAIRSKILSKQNHSCDILIGDSLGEMTLYYSMSSIVIMGGTFVPHGGHNILEPAALGKPIFYGASMYNFAAINSLFLSHQASIQVNNIDELQGELEKYMHDKNKLEQLGRNAYQLINKNSGSIDRIYNILERYQLFK